MTDRVLQEELLNFSPLTGLKWVVRKCSASEYREKWPSNTWYYNPWTGVRRDHRDVESDPQGLLIVPPGAQDRLAPCRAHDVASARAELEIAAEKEPDTKPTNPKDIVGSSKLPLHLWPATASALGCLGLMDGALKYGRSNFRAVGVRASIYVDAAKRHLDAWFEGEDLDPDSGLPHFAHALACIAILVDSQAAGKLNDDRMVAGGYRKLIGELTPHVARLRELHAGKDPKHYTIGDTV